MIWLAWLIAATPVGTAVESVRDLKEQERSMVDVLDDMLADKKRLTTQAQTLQQKLSALETSIAAQRQELERAQEVNDLTKADAQKRLRSMQRLVRGEAARFLVASDNLAEGLQRARAIRLLMRRDAVRLQQSQVAMAQYGEQEAKLSAQKQEAATLLTSVQAVQEELLQKSQQMQQVLVQLRGDRAHYEKTVFDLKEEEARLQEEAEEDTGAGDPFHQHKGSLPWPAKGAVSKSFGRQEGSGAVIYRSGITLAVAPKTSALAVSSGVVLYKGSAKGYDQLVMVRHSPHYVSVYGGLSEVLVKPGQNVQASQVLGRARGETVYFEMRRGQTAEDPLRWLRAP